MTRRLCATIFAALVAAFFVPARADTLSEAVRWVNENTKYDIEKMPSVHFGTPEVLSTLKYNNPSIEVLGLYECSTRRLWLTFGFATQDRFQKSIIIHELVHHAQCVTGAHALARCGSDLEEEAYDIQEKWLTQNGQPEGFIGDQNPVLMRVAMKMACEDRQ